MNVNLQIEAGQLGETVIDLFRNLSVEKKEEVALTILREWFREPVQLETVGYEETLLAAFKADESRMRKVSYSNYSVVDDATIKASYAYREELAKYKNTKQYMVEDLRKELLAFFKKGIEDEMKADTKLDEIKKIVYDEITNRIPEIMMTVVTLALTNNMVELQHKIQDNVMKNYQFGQFKDSVMSRLNMQG